jgi:hypothetical protein
MTIVHHHGVRRVLCSREPRFHESEAGLHEQDEDPSEHQPREVDRHAVLLGLLRDRGHLVPGRGVARYDVRDLGARLRPVAVAVRGLGHPAQQHAEHDQ